jgi:hypothetical protein
MPRTTEKERQRWAWCPEGMRREPPQYLLKKNGKLREMPADGRCRVCGECLTRGPTAFVCGSPRCHGSPLVPPEALSRRAKLIAWWREMRPWLIDD